MQEATKVILIHQKFSNEENGTSDTIMVSGVPITSSNVARWVYTFQVEYETEPSIKIDIDLNKSLSLTGSNAVDAHEYLLSCFEERLDIYK